jgi:hypothetical protein
MSSEAKGTQAIPVSPINAQQERLNALLEEHGVSQIRSIYHVNSDIERQPGTPSKTLTTHSTGLLCEKFPSHS